jgi:hypothetical protein
MSPHDTIALIAKHLESAGIPFMVAGSICSSYHSQPRTTNDIDLVIDSTPAQLDHLLSMLGSKIYVSQESARQALRDRSMFNIIDLTNGWKVDLIVRKNRPFSIEEFQRRQTGIVEGHSLPIATPEDIILSKLEWNLITPSERQVRDALNVAIAKWPALDRDYLRKWAPALGVTDQLLEVLRVAEEAQPPPGT